MIRLGHVLFRWRNALFPCAFALVFLPGPRLFTDPVVALAWGALCAALGQALRSLTIGLKYIVRGGRERRVYARDLVTGGIYAHTRNPMYLGNLLLLTGIAIASNSWACVAIAVPLFAFFYQCIVAAEEQFLRGTFGAAFVAYAREVPRWGWRLKGLFGTLRPAGFHWRRLLIKEYGTACGWIGGLSLLGLLHLTRNTMPVAPHEHVRALLLMALTMAAVTWILTLLIKKARLIVAD